MSMRKNGNFHSVRMFSDRRWILPFFGSLLVSISLLLSALFLLFSTPNTENPIPVEHFPFERSRDTSGDFVESDLWKEFNKTVVSKTGPPRLAYLISGTKGDGQRMLRTLMALYHPRNRYILHLDLEAPVRERLNLSTDVKNDPTFVEVGNVHVMAQSNLVTYKGPTMIANTLQAIAILLRESLEWDWFINLSASDYPLVTQDDMLHVFSNLTRNLNFIEHTKLRGWKLNQRVKPIIIDPGLYLSKKYDLAWTTQRRSVPTSFKLFTGSAWVMLTRPFLEYCIWGWENLPRTILMYYTNFVSSPEGYFHTVICNTDEFRTTVISHDLHYIAWDSPPKQHPIALTMKDYDKMVKSGAPFARKFPKEDPVLDKIDQELLQRGHRFAPGAWCVGSSKSGADPCLLLGDNSVFRPGPGALRLQELLQKLLSDDFRNQQCVS